MTPHSLVRRLAWLTALRWLPVGLTVPVLVLLVQARGLDVAATGWLLAVYSAVTLLLELPTGGLADVIGRRPVLVASAVASAAGAALFAVGTGGPALVAGAVLAAVGRALGSGPLEAWYVDSVRRDEPTADIRRGLAAARSAEAAALGVGAVVGGLVPAWVAAVTGDMPVDPTHPVIPLSIPFLVAAGLHLVNAVAVATLVRGPGPHAAGRGTARGSGPPLAGSISTTVRDGLRLAGRNGGVRRLMVFSAGFGFALSGVELLSPGHVAGLLGGAEAGGAAYGVLVAAGFGASALGAWLVPRLALQQARRWAVALNSAAALAVCLVGAPVMAVVAASYTLAYFLLGAGGPLVAEMLHDRVPERTRSTVLSLESLTLQSGGLLASLTLGTTADRAGVWPSLTVVGAVLLAGALLLPRADPPS